jgi:hypothetical protein
MRRSGNPRVTVVVPTRNEARNLEVVLPAVAAVQPTVHEIIVVDGRSVDGTVETAQRVLPAVKVIHQTRRGKGNAMACGFAAATGDVIVMFDADGSADPTEIPHTPTTDDTLLWGDGYEIETVLNCRVAAAGLKITEVPSVERQRIFGRTNLRTFADGTRVLRTLAAERRRAVRRHARGAGRLTGRRIGAEPFTGYATEGYATEGYGAEGYDTEGYGAEGYGAEGYDPEFYIPVQAGEQQTGETDAFGPAGFPEPPDDAHAFTSAGGITVAPREPLDAAPDAGAGRSPRGGGRAHEWTGPGGASSPNRDRSGVRYALEEGSS